MKKNLFRLIALASCACIVATGAALSGCNNSNKADNVGSKGLHLIDPKPLGGENVLDDGGKINIKGSSYSFKGAVYEEAAEHKISFETDGDKYEVVGGLQQKVWSNSDRNFKRFQVTSAAAAVIFKFDFSGVEDVSRIGCAINLIACRGSVLFSVSTDKEEWLDIGYNTAEGIRCDAKEHLDELSGKKVSDKNLYRMYYLLGDYIGESKVLYFKAGFSKKYFQGADAANNGIGADLIDCVTYYDGMKLVGVSV